MSSVENKLELPAGYIFRPLQIDDYTKGIIKIILKYFLICGTQDTWNAWLN